MTDDHAPLWAYKPCTYHQHNTIIYICIIFISRWYPHYMPTTSPLVPGKNKLFHHPKFICTPRYRIPHSATPSDHLAGHVYPFSSTCKVCGSCCGRGIHPHPQVPSMMARSLRNLASTCFDVENTQWWPAALFVGYGHGGHGSRFRHHWKGMNMMNMMNIHKSQPWWQYRYGRNIDVPHKVHSNS